MLRLSLNLGGLGLIGVVAMLLLCLVKRGVLIGKFKQKLSLTILPGLALVGFVALVGGQGIAVLQSLDQGSR
ncbi:hypothetical protein AWQ23_00475 [Picosynechococcus sp. PCC 73109]|nr:hypothetical protein AWQ23_00475 [Picosynechococcus sp. PCC 73109]